MVPLFYDVSVRRVVSVPESSLAFCHCEREGNCAEANEISDTKRCVEAALGAR